MRLSPPEFKRLLGVLLDAYTVRDDLVTMLSIEVGRPLDANTGSLRNDMARLITSAQQEGWLHELVAGARQDRPAHPGLQAFAAEFTPVLTPADPFEAPVVRANRPFLDRRVLRDALRDLERETGKRLLVVVKGNPRSGKSYSRQLISYVAEQRQSTTIVWINLQDLQRASGDGRVWPDAIGARVFDQMGLDAEALPMKGNEQYARWTLLFCDRLTGQLAGRTERWWIVVDEFNSVPLPPDSYDFFKALAVRADINLPCIRLILLGYDETLPREVTDAAHWESVAPISQGDLIAYFTKVSAARNNPPDEQEVATAVQRVWQSVDPASSDFAEAIARAVVRESQELLRP